MESHPMRLYGVDPASGSDETKEVTVMVGKDGQRIVVLTPEQYEALKLRGEAPPTMELSDEEKAAILGNIRVSDPAVSFPTGMIAADGEAMKRALEDAGRALARRRFFRSGVRSKVLPLRRSRPVGRNDPCPCGSGRKFKKCCYLSAKPGGVLGARPK